MNFKSAVLFVAALNFMEISLTYCVQPYFPPQVTFYTANDRVLMAIDEINQRAYQAYTFESNIQYAIVMEHFPDPVPHSPQAKYYVQMVMNTPSNDCMYGTYWKYGGFYATSVTFPSHWNPDTATFNITNYINFKYMMIHATDNLPMEDYWYSDESCQIYTGETFPCEEIFFQKGTDMPIRTTQVIRQGWDMMRETTNYRVISVGEPDQHFFDKIPKDWTNYCKDTMLGIQYDRQIISLNVNASVNVHASLTTPPHQIYQNDTVIIEWKLEDDSKCSDCVINIPNQLSFNIENFRTQQILHFILKREGTVTFTPKFYGGGFDTVDARRFQLYFS